MKKWDVSAKRKGEIRKIEIPKQTKKKGREEHKEERDNIDGTGKQITQIRREKRK